MANYTLKTTISAPEKDPIEYETSIIGENNQSANNTTLYALLHGHILLLQKELETLEILMKRHSK